MLNPKKKLAKKEIKEDTLLTAYAKMNTYYYENKKYVNYALTLTTGAARMRPRRASWHGSSRCTKRVRRILRNTKLQ